MKEQLPRRDKIARVHDVLPECNEITINLLPVCLQIVSEAASRIPEGELYQGNQGVVGCGSRI